MNGISDMKAEPPACGVLLFDKPAGPSSHDIVARVRRRCGIRKVGHGGTLDPFATGLLLMLVGRATRLFDYFMPLSKEYLVTIQFGAVSDTGDSEGKITPSSGEVGESELGEILADLKGSVRQKVPAYSAVKVDGERLYRKARKGEAVVAPTRTVEIHDIEVESFDGEEQQAVLRVSCSKGTYIRQLCVDIGERAGSGAYAAELRRTAIGDFRVDDAMDSHRLETSEAAALLSPEENPSFISCLGALYFLPVREIPEAQIKTVANGRPLDGEATGPVRLAYEGRLMAVYGPGETSGSIVPLVVFS
jgi:tRNA pseudouridine55 synthase